MAELRGSCRKLTDALSPQRLTVENDSAKHAGHAAMKAIGGGGGETHFKCGASH